MSVGYSARALADLSSIAAYISRRSVRGAASVMRRIEATITLIERHPGVGQKVRRRSGTRAIPIGKYPYKVYYQIENGTPMIVHVRHGARKLPSPAEMSGT
jgi:toxin ParE1/3/4